MSETRFVNEYRRALKKRLWMFQRDEEGSLVIFSLFIFLCMIIIGGVAVDLMLYENERTHLQNSTDRAVLAAANLDQTVDPKTVVVDYLAKVGINISEDDVTVREVGTMPVITGRQVSVDINGQFETLLMNIVGVEDLPLSGNSEATEAINDVEVSLVLDISGSMGWNSKLSRMQDAANDFATQILAGAEDDGRVSLSVVPYSTQVSAGDSLLGLMNTQHSHNRSHCVNFPSTAFDTTAIDHTVSLSQTAHFDPWKGYNGYSGDSTREEKREPENFVCRTEAHADILPWQNDIGTITGQINSLTAGGNTSIDVAVKWGVALLDPSMQTQLTALQGTGDVPADFVQRPFAYDRPDTLKFIVVMTDGINTTQYYLNDAYKQGPSPVWKFTDNDANDTVYYSSADEEPNDLDNDGDWNEEFWYPRGRYFLDQPYHDQSTGYEGPVVLDPGQSLVQMDWLDVWSEMSMSWRAYHLFYRQNWNANHYYNNYWQGSSAPLGQISASTKDDRLDDICDAAKDQNVVIFTIGFEVTDSSAAVMKSCASTPSHFYRVEGLDIEYAFASIANKINQLKLTQ